MSHFLCVCVCIYTHAWGGDGLKGEPNKAYEEVGGGGDWEQVLIQAI